MAGKISERNRNDFRFVGLIYLRLIGKDVLPILLFSIVASRQELYTPALLP